MGEAVACYSGRMELLILVLIALGVAVAAVALREDKWLKQDDFSWLDVSEKIDLDEEVAPKKKPAKKTAKKAVKKTAKKPVKKAAKKKR